MKVKVGFQTTQMFYETIPLEKLFHTDKTWRKLSVNEQMSLIQAYIDSNTVYGALSPIEIKTIGKVENA
jgi:hypothetical protein